MWTIKCKHCKKKSRIDELDVIDKALSNMDMVTVALCNFCGSQMEIQLSVTKAEGLIEFN